MKNTPTLVFATRPSALARWQTQWVIRALQAAHPGLTCREEVIVTRGDRVLDRSLPEIGGKGLFTQELEAALLSGRVQAAVHSLKDLPTTLPPGLTVGAVPARAEVRDALVSAQGYTLETLPAGAVVGTSSLRRRRSCSPPAPMCAFARCAATWTPACARPSPGSTTPSCWPGPG